MADHESIIAEMREYGTAGLDAYLGPNHMALCLKQQANIWADQLAALSQPVAEAVGEGPKAALLQIAKELETKHGFDTPQGRATWELELAARIRYAIAPRVPLASSSWLRGTGEGV